MKASELVQALNALIEEHGDLDVFTQEYRQATNKYELFPVELVRDIYDEQNHIIFVE